MNSIEIDGQIINLDKVARVKKDGTYITFYTLKGGMLKFFNFSEIYEHDGLEMPHKKTDETWEKILKKMGA